MRLGRLVTFNPDVSIWIGQSFGRKVRVVPGATVNLRFKRFFIGGGAVGRVPEWAGSETGTGERAGGWLVPKAQVGYLAGPTRLTVSLLLFEREQGRRRRGNHRHGDRAPVEGLSPGRAAARALRAL